MEQQEITRLCNGYLNYCRDKNNQDFHYWQSVHQIIEQDLEVSWSVLLTLLKLSRDESELAYIAAGLLEDFIAIYHQSIQEKLMHELRVNSKLRQAIQGVWLDEKQPAGRMLRKLLEKFGLKYSSL